MGRISFDKEEIFISTFDDPLLVSFNYTKGGPGSMYKSNGDPGDPPEGDELEILSAMFDGVDVYDTLTIEEREEIVDACLQIVYEAEEASYDRRYKDEWR